MRSLLKRLLARLRSGVSLADAMAENSDTFPPYYASMVRAGEASGALDVVLGRLGEFLEKSQALRETVKTALYYPVFLLIMALFQSLSCSLSLFLNLSHCSKAPERHFLFRRECSSP